MRTLTPDEWTQAIGLADGMLHHYDRGTQPLALSTIETRLICSALVLLHSSVKDKPADPPKAKVLWTMDMEHMNHIDKVHDEDRKMINVKENEYRGSWKRRGGVGAFMMLARKWDRLEPTVAHSEFNYDIFRAIEEDRRPEGIIDDIKDLRRYLALVHAYAVAKGWVKP